MIRDLYNNFTISNTDNRSKKMLIMIKFYSAVWKKKQKKYKNISQSQEEDENTVHTLQNIIQCWNWGLSPWFIFHILLFKNGFILVGLIEM